MKSNVQAADIILMSAYIHNHNYWSLLVCNLTRECWHFYDSLPNKTHQGKLYFAVYCTSRTCFFIYQNIKDSNSLYLHRLLGFMRKERVCFQINCRIGQ
ncbi:hypothetical protein KSP40_PGU012610 [Platanthera guangdongensis]|uniref:Uncharacterized protein n=1 Tax=Platanthera guangdongensis TaxID=2320717 RepID=A0ABR2LRT9_9ASPA